MLANDRLESEKKAKEEADEQRKLAEANLRQARAAVDRYFTLVSESTLLDEPGLQPLRLELIEAAISYYETFAARRSDDPQIQLELAATHLRLAQINNTLKRQDDKITALEKGFALVEKARRKQPAKSDAYLALAGFWHGGRGLPGRAVQQITDPSHALSVFRKGVGLWDRFVEVHPAAEGFQSDLSKFYDNMGGLQHLLGRRDDMIHSKRKVIEIREKLVRDHPDIPKYKAELSYGYLHLAAVFELEDSDPQQAEALYRRAITTQLEADFLPYRQSLAKMHQRFARFLQGRNHPNEAMAECRKAMAIYEKLAAEYPHISGYQASLSGSQQLLADLLKTTGHTEEAEQIIRDMIDASNPRTVEEYVQRAKLFEQLKEYDKALADYDKAVELAPEVYLWRTKRAGFFADRGRWQEAANELAKAVEFKPDYYYIRYQLALTSLGANDHSKYGIACQHMLAQFAVSNIPRELHFTAWACVLAPDAIVDYSQAIRMARQVVTLEPIVVFHQQCLGAILFRAGQLDEALKHLQIAAESDVVEKSSPVYGWYFLAMTHHKLGNQAEAKQWLDKAITGTEKILDESRNNYEPVLWNRKLTLELLRTEAVQLLEIPVEAQKPGVRNQEAEKKRNQASRMRKHSGFRITNRDNQPTKTRRLTHAVSH